MKDVAKEASGATNTSQIRTATDSSRWWLTLVRAVNRIAVLPRVANNKHDWMTEEL
jgi:hypothetical protein